MASLTPEENLTIVKHLAEKAANVPECGYIIPAPIYFADKADFSAQVRNVAINTQKAMDKSQIAMTVITFGRFEDLTEDGESDEPQVNFYYSFYIFRQYNPERMDERDAPDDFLKRMLKSYNDFISALLKMRTEFLGANPISELDPERFAEANTLALAQDESIFENEPCRYVPQVRGFAAELTGTVEILIKEC